MDDADRFLHVGMPVLLLVAWALLAGLSLGMLWLLTSFLRLEVRRPYRQSLYVLTQRTIRRSMTGAVSAFRTLRRRHTWARVRKQTADRRWMRRP